ncbi:NAD(P)-dependent oxidoreductase [Lacihabitans sp. CCS-44]|uniref:NAD-dependent epimerase/dehydratase family protein n=1 Tax=Lacihabitans sp. CCS-44 TaxID=2487331 RepID=UPI0020CE608D|nr:NAD(P)-dependent oxidoreductase [Lacihabitans sp. CCS-44]MCP9754967.1 NAD(P)-dependent oxidoreductase [Lacihabitans sp. CCS-44]
MPIAVVVGANGFLGSGIVNELIRQGIEVLAVYNERFDNINKFAKLISSEQLLNYNLEPDFFFFAPGNYASTHKELLKLNHLLYLYSLKFSNSKFIYLSSTNVYGIHDDIISENSTYNNPGLYALSKLSGEFIVSGMSNFSIIRFTYIYGATISNNSFIPQIINSAKNKGQIVLFGNGSRVQDYIYVDDAVNFCLKSAMIEQSSIYLGVTGLSISNKEIAEEIAKWVDCKIEFSGLEIGQSFHFNPQKTFDLLNWSPKVTISEGIKRMLH